MNRPPWLKTARKLARLLPPVLVLAGLASPAALAAPGNRAPRILGNPPASASEGTVYGFVVRGVDPDGDALTFTVANLPAWASFVDNGDKTASFTGTPGVGSAGSYTDVTVTVSDGALTAALGPFAIDVAGPNRAPEIFGTPRRNVPAGVLWSLSLQATDADGDALSFQATNAPGWSALVDHGDGTATLSGTPGSPDAGVYPDVTLQVSDGIDTGTLNPFTVTVSDNANQAPVLSGTPVLTAAEGDLYEFTVSATDPDGDPLTFRVTNRPIWASLVDNGDGTATLSGTPGFTQAGVYARVGVRVADGRSASTLPEFSITVADTNRPPVIEAAMPPTQVPEGGTYSFNVMASDDDGDPLTYEVVRVPPWASFVDNLDGTGTLSGMPDFDSARTYRAVSISVTDGDLTTEFDSFPIEVLDVNRVPELTGTPPPTAKEDEVYSFTLSANDPDGDPLTFQLSGRPSWMSHATDATSITLTGLPSFDDAGRYADIQIDVMDGRSRATVGPFSITVEDTNRPPTFHELPLLEAWHGLAYHANVAAADGDGDAVTLAVVPTLPGWLTFVDNGDGTGELFGVPGPGDVGSLPVVQLLATDGSRVAVQQVVMSVSELSPDGVPSVPVGIYALDRVIDRPWVSGVAVRRMWSEMEPVPGQYDFEPLVKMVRSAQAVGQAVTLVNLLRDAPDWLLATTETYVEASGTVRIVPWDETMLVALENLIAAQSSFQIDGLALPDHPTIKQVSSSLGGANSIRLQPAPPGYSLPRYETAVFRTLDAWAAAYPVGKHLYLGVFGIDAPNGFEETRQLRDAILSSFNGVDAPRMNFFQEVLTGISPTPMGLGMLLSDVTDQTGVLLQACGAWTQQDTIWERCNWIEPLDHPDDGFVNALQYGTTYYEIYTADLENPEYDATFEAWAEIIAAYARTIP